MVTQCPKCQVTQRIEFNQFDEDSVIFCGDCQSPLRIKVVLEIAGNAGEQYTNSLDQALPSSEKRENQKSVIVCIDGEATRAVVKEILEQADFHVLDIPSGISTFMSMKLEAPEVALIDAGFTDMSGTELSAQIKGNSDLKNTATLLVSSMFEKNTKYRQQPPNLYGADDYIDRIQIQTQLLSKIETLLKNKANGQQKSLDALESVLETPSAEELLTGGGESPSANEISEERVEVDEQSFQGAEAPETPPSVQASSGEASSEIPAEAPMEEDSEALKEARRLAKLIVSDIALYNEEKVVEGLQKGIFYQILENDIKEGERLYESRVDESLYDLGIFEQEIKSFIEKRKESQDQRPEIMNDFPEAVQKLDVKTDKISQTPEADTSEAEPETETEISAGQGPIFDKSDEALKKATQISRDIISDIIKSNEDNLPKVIEIDDLYEILGDEIMTGRQLFEQKVPAYFDSSLYEEEIDRILEERNGGEGPLVDEILSNPETKSPEGQNSRTSHEGLEIPEPEDSVDVIKQIEQEAVNVVEGSPPPMPESAWEDSVIPETQNTDDVFKQMEQEATGVPEGSPPPMPESAWEDSVIPETQNTDDVFKQMEQEAGGVSEEAVSQTQENIWEDSIPPEVKNTRDDFREMDQEIDPAVTGDIPQTTDSAWDDSFAGPIPEDPNDLFNQLEQEVSAVAEVDTPALEKADLSPENGEIDDLLGNQKSLSNQPEQDASIPQLEKDKALPEMGSTDDIFGKMESPKEAFEQDRGTPQLQEDKAHTAASPQSEVTSTFATSEIEDSNEIKEAKRIAKIILSDIVIYNEKKVEEGIKNNTFHLVLQEEIKEGRIHFESRVSKNIFKSGLFENVIDDFILDRNTTADQSAPSPDNTPDVVEEQSEFFPAEPTAAVPSPEEDIFGIESNPEIETRNAATEAPSAPMPSGNGNALVAETKVEKEALRLAKIIVSDIVIYNEDKVEKGIQFGNFYEILEEEIKEGEALYESRVSKEILEEKNYLKEAIEDFISKKSTASS